MFSKKKKKVFKVKPIFRLILNIAKKKDNLYHHYGVSYYDKS